MIRAAILDDEEKGSALLEHKLRTFADRLEVVAVFNDPEHALKQIKELDIDVLFLDIEMPRINGFKFLELLGSFDFEIIFVTAYDAYVLQALRNDALDYLMKPVDPEELQTALEKLEQRYRGRIVIPKNTPRDRGRLSLPTAEGIYYIKRCDIIRIEAMSNYSVFYLSPSGKIVVSRTLKEYELLLDDDCFFRVNRSTIVNLDFVVKYRKGDGGVLELANGAEIEVSSSKKVRLLEKLS